MEEPNNDNNDNNNNDVTCSSTTQDDPSHSSSSNNDFAVFKTTLTELTSSDDDESLDIEDGKSQSHRTSRVETTGDTSVSKNQDVMLQKALQDVGLSSYGAMMTELWVFDQQHNNNYAARRLSRKACWVDPNYQQLHCACYTLPKTDCCPVCKVTDSTHQDYIYPTPVAIGEGLPGVLWASAIPQSSATRREQQQSLNVSRHSQTSVGTATSTSALSFATPSNWFGQHYNNNSSAVTWRHLHSMAHDPDQAWNARMMAIAELPQVEWVTGIPFQFPQSQRGLLIVVSQGNSLSNLCSATHEDYLYMSAQHVGSLYCWRRSQQTMMLEGNVGTRGGGAGFGVVTDMDKVVSSSRHKNSTLQEKVIMEEQEDSTELRLNDSITDETLGFWGLFWQDLRGRAFSVVSKAKGAGLPPPPPMSTNESFVTFVGVFWTLLLLTLLNGVVRERLGREYEIVLGPFGALVTLLYGLSSAPASQPRNAILGQTISLTIAIIVSKYCPFLSVWMKQSLGTAIAVAMMSRLGITHPPAGAAALIFTGSEDLGWGNLLALVIATTLALLSATFINNWSDKRQYPSFWGIRPARRPASS